MCYNVSDVMVLMNKILQSWFRTIAQVHGVRIECWTVIDLDCTHLANG